LIEFSQRRCLSMETRASIMKFHQEV